MSINILYEDKSILVCIKPVGLESENGGMPAHLCAQCGVDKIFCVHRLDKGVGGVMVYAKTSKAASVLSAAMERGELRKEYLAVLPARPETESGILRDLLYRDAKKNKSYVVTRMRRGVREAELEYSTLATAESLTLVRIRLHTGRSHQIRVQFASRALPLLGDVKYGSRYRDCGIALFSCALAFPHPLTGAALSFDAVPEALFPWSCFA